MRPMSKTVEFLFDFGSPNAYLSHRVVPAIEARTGGRFVYTPVLLGGILSLVNMERAMDEGFDFVAMGRALIADPDLVRRMRRGDMARSRCISCNECVAEMDRGGVRCVLG